MEEPEGPAIFAGLAILVGCGMILLLPFAWIGHAYLLTGVLNNLYGRPLPKPFLRIVRALVGLLILAFPALVWFALTDDGSGIRLLIGPYLSGCALVGAIWFPLVTAYRMFRPLSECIRASQSTVIDFGKELGDAAAGGRIPARIARLPGNDIFRVEFTEMALAVPGLPAAWDGLTVLLLSDLHFHGTPSRAWFDRVLDHLTAMPTPDVVVLGGDYVDTDRHREWIGPVLGRLKWTELGIAVLGNHDAHHDPEAVRKELGAAGFRVMSNRWEETTIRGERCVLVGHEGPWFGPPPDLTGMPADAFKLCVSHTPDNFPWGVRHGLNLMLCGHVHGGQIRVPVVGSIFVPSVHGRRFDQGVFADRGTVMVVGRGLGGKEPIRLRCPPQVIRLTLKAK